MFPGFLRSGAFTASCYYRSSERSLPRGAETRVPTRQSELRAYCVCGVAAHVVLFKYAEYNNPNNRSRNKLFVFWTFYDFIRLVVITPNGFVWKKKSCWSVRRKLQRRAFVRRNRFTFNNIDHPVVCKQITRLDRHLISFVNWKTVRKRVTLPLRYNNTVQTPCTGGVCRFKCSHTI